MVFAELLPVGTPFMWDAAMPFVQAEEGMLPSFLAKKHKKYGTPVNAILLIAAVTLTCAVFR